MIVGFVGFIGSGKGTAGDILCEKYGFIKESFAKPVKDIASVMFGWDRKLLEGDTKESREWREQKDGMWSELLGKDFSPRLALQLIGTEVGRNVFHPDLWIKMMESRLTLSTKDYVITDVRFPNEMRFIHEMGGKVIEIQRGNNPEWYGTAAVANIEVKESIAIPCIREMKEKYKIHESEWKWIGSLFIDTVIKNDEGIEELERNIKNYLTL